MSLLCMSVKETDNILNVYLLVQSEYTDVFNFTTNDERHVGGVEGVKKAY